MKCQMTNMKFHLSQLIDGFAIRIWFRTNRYSQRGESQTLRM